MRAPGRGSAAAADSSPAHRPARNLRLNSRWLALAPQEVDGWRATVERARRGTWVVTWAATGDGLANDEIGDFPLAVTWPETPGDCATPTV